MGESIRIDGLDEFTSSVRTLGRDVPALVRLSLDDATDLVVGPARRKVPTMTGRAARSVRAEPATGTTAAVVGGGGRAPYYPWLDFGGRVGRRESVSRPFRTEGRYIIPTAQEAAKAGRFEDVMAAALVDVAARAGVKVES